MTATRRRATIAAVVLASVLSMALPKAQAIRAQTLPVVWVLGTGGTIAGRGSSRGVAEYKAGGEGDAGGGEDEEPSEDEPPA